MDPINQLLVQQMQTAADRAPSSVERKLPRTTAFYREKRGRPSRKTKAERQQYLTPPEEKALVMYLLRMAALGFPIRVKFMPSLAFSIARRRSTKKAIKPPNKNWPQAFARRHPQIKARKKRPIDRNRYDDNIRDKIAEWFEVIKPELCRPDVLPENVYNMDETGVMLSMLGSVKVLVGRDDQRDYGAGVKRTMVTAIECVWAVGEYLNPMIIWPASTHRSNWTTYPTPGWVYACSESGYTDSYISLQWMKQVFDPQTKARADGRPRILICDGFGTHETLEILEFCFENNIVLCRLPSHTSHKTQPCDVSVFGPLKTAYRNQVERLYRSGVNVVNKEHFTSLYSLARAEAITRRNTLAGWAKAGLFPFNPDRVLRDIKSPVAAAPICAVREGTYQRMQDEVTQTPVTPVSAENLASLLMQIAQEPQDGIGKQHYRKLVTKLGNAAQTSFARHALDQDHIQFLTEMNDESKARRNTPSKILKKGKGKGRVMTFEDLEIERAERTEREAAKEAKAKKKRGRTPKDPLSETGDVTKSRGKRSKKRKAAASEPDEPDTPRPAVLVAANEAYHTAMVDMPDCQRAPVAKMY